MDNNTDNKKLLYEVSYIRPIVIFLLVLLHSFEKITSGGMKVHDYQLNILYQWLSELIKGFRIETIALVAGYVFAYQTIDLGRKYKFIPFAKKKFNRLILPMVFFGMIYYFCFYFNADSFSISSMLLNIFSGSGHLWFLPMLFWCFIGLWIFDYFKLDSWKFLLTLAIFSLVPTLNAPLGFGRLPHFLFYVYGGYYLWTKHNLLQQKMMNTRGITLLWIIYVLLVVFLHYYKASNYSGEVFALKGFYILFGELLTLLEACSGTIALYLTICSFTTRENFRPSSFVVASSKVCYGVYVYHQFILVYLYFYTPLFDSVNEYVLPIIGCVLTVLISLGMTHITLKTKLGRMLIG